jgi:hypothetical protein
MQGYSKIVHSSSSIFDENEGRDLQGAFRGSLVDQYRGDFYRNMENIFLRQLTKNT